MKIKESRARRLFNTSNVIVLLLLAFLCLFPFIHVLAVSFSNKVYVSAGMVTFWPKGFTLASYSFLIRRQAFWNSFGVSIYRTILGGSINVFLIILTAYPLSKDSARLRFRTAYAWFFFVTMLISGGLIPNYLLITSLKLRDTIWALVLPGAVPVYNLILMLSFFRQVPVELEEAAVIDGAGTLRTLFQIYVPVSVPAIATITLFCVVHHWNAWFDGMLYISSPDKLPLQTFLRGAITNLDMSDVSSADWDLIKLMSDRSLKCAQIVIACIPILCIYPFLQRYFVKGIVLGSVKG